MIEKVAVIGVIHRCGPAIFAVFAVFAPAVFQPFRGPPRANPCPECGETAGELSQHPDGLTV